MRPGTAALVGACLLLPVLPCPAPACKYSYNVPRRKTLAKKIAEADSVFFGTLANPTLTNPPAEGVTDIVVHKIIKRHPAIKDYTKLQVEQYLPNVVGKQLLILCDVHKGKINPYEGIPLPANSAMPRYIEGVLQLQGAKADRRLRYFFDFLQHPEPDIADDALREFEVAAHTDVRTVAKGLPPEKLIGWLKDPKTRAKHRGLYAILLGHCSKDRKRDAKLLRSLDGPALAGKPAVADLLIGQVLLRPQAGWQHVRGILSDPRNEFMRRYAASRCLRFFAEQCPDVVPRKKLVEGTALLLGQEDIADIAVENLRKWKCWEMTDRVLALEGKESHDVPIIKRAVLRFALCSPKESAKEFVKAARQRDAQLVSDAEELLKLEQGTTTAKPN